MEPQSFEIAMTQNEYARVISLSGEIDFAASLDLGPALSKAVDGFEGELLFDLSNVTFIDSEGIKTLLITFHNMGHKRSQARIVSCSRRAMRVMKLAGVDTILNADIEPTDEQVTALELSRQKRRQHRVRPLKRTSRSDCSS